MKNIFISVFISVFILGCNTKKTFLYSNKNNYKHPDLYVNTINQTDLKKNLTVLASDQYEGRETAKSGQKKAAKYISEYFKNIGLSYGANDSSYFQHFPVSVKNPYKVNIKIDGKKINFLEDFFYVGNFVDTNIKNIEVVYLNYGIIDKNYSDYNNINVEGKIVIIKDGVPKNLNLDKDWNNWRKKISIAKEKGAIALFTIKSDFEERLEILKYYVQNPKMELHNKGIRKKTTSIPNFFISKKVAKEYFKINKNTKIGEIPIKVDLNLKINQILHSENILGIVEGTDKKDEYVIISAHYDHLGYDAGEICNGADDNGSGTVAILQLAKAFAIAKEKGHSPRRNILFIAFSGEEKGLLGSKYYTNNPIYPLKKTIANLNIDMIGRIDANHTNNNYIYVIGSDKISSDLHEINEQSNKNKIKLELDYTYNDESDPNRFYYRSDHYNFAKNDIPVIFYFSGVHEDYHKPTDDVEKIDFEKIEKTTKLVYYVAWELANRKNNLNRIKK